MFLAATKQLYEWYFLSVCLSVCLSVTHFRLCSHHGIITKFSGVIANDRSDVHAKGQGQRSKVKVTEVTTQLKDRAYLSTFKFFILGKFSCIVVLIVFFVIVQSSGLTSVCFREKMTFFLNFISFHIFAIYVGGACWGLPAACRLIAVSGARLLVCSVWP